MWDDIFPFLFSLLSLIRIIYFKLRTTASSNISSFISFALREAISSLFAFDVWWKSNKPCLASKTAQVQLEVLDKVLVQMCYRGFKLKTKLWNVSVIKIYIRVVEEKFIYRDADKSLARPDWKKKTTKVAIFPRTRRSLLPRRPGWTDKFLNCFWVACKS